MIVTCPDCDTSFQLDESRVPEKGIRVRCSRCKHAFHLANPSTSKSAAIDAVALEAVGDETSTPSVTQDLTSPPPPALAQGGEVNNEDDAEWEFNHDDSPLDGSPSDSDVGFGSDANSTPELEVDSPAAPAAELAEPAETAEREGSAFSSDESMSLSTGLELASPDDEHDFDASGGLDLASDDDHAQAVPSAAPELGSSTGAPEVASDDDAFGSVDDFSSLMEDDESGVGSDLLDTDSTSDLLGEQPGADDGLYSGSSESESESESDALGDPENWDFFDDESAGPATPSPSAPAASAIGQIGVTSPGAAAASPVEFDDDVGASGLGHEGWLQHAIQSTGRLIGWTVVLVGCAFGLVSGLWTTAESFVVGERTTTFGSVEAVDMQAHWVDTARAGQLLVVTGGLRNVTDAPTTLPGPIEIALLDRLGGPLAIEPTALGVELAARQIRELPVEVLAHMRARAARLLQTAVIPVGGLLAFQAVIFDPPSEGLRFKARLAPDGRLSLPTPSAAEESLDESSGLEAGFEDESRLLEEAERVAAVEEAQPAEEPGEAGADYEAAAPGYDDPYGTDPGIGLEDL